MDHHNDKNGATHEAITFNAEQHVEFFEETLKFYGLSFGDKDKFITNQIADNAMVNKRIAQILGIPHVRCANHKFNLEIEAYLKKDFEDVIEHTRATMVAIANSTKNRALLRTMTDKSPLYYNDTRWYGKYFMVKRWLELFDFVKEANKLIQEREGRRAKQIPLNIGAAFKPKVEACKSYLESFHKTHLAMEKQGATLEACREHLDTWVYAMTYPSNNEADKLYGCGLGTKWISSNANIVTDRAFEQGVVKIQRGEHYLLTDMEKEAVVSLLRKDNEAAGSISESESGTDNEDDDPVSPCTRAENNKRQRLNAKQHVQSPYVNCDYILGSVAEVERLWSLAKYVIPDHCKKSHPIHVEALLFLKVNRSF